MVEEEEEEEEEEEAEEEAAMHKSSLSSFQPESSFQQLFKGWGERGKRQYNII